MAPIRKPSSSGTTARKSILKKTSEPKKIQADPLFPNTKQDKRRIKHAHLLSKIEKSSIKTPRRRRPNKKLVTTLDALADALPDGDGQDIGRPGSRPEDQVNIIRRKSMKSKPGAMKRREKIDKVERDRFAMNLAQMAQTTNDEKNSTTRPGVTATSENRWKALRSFIGQTMEKKPGINPVPG